MSQNLANQSPKCNARLVRLIDPPTTKLFSFLREIFLVIKSCSCKGGFLPRRCRKVRLLRLFLTPRDFDCICFFLRRICYSQTEIQTIQHRQCLHREARLSNTIRVDFQDDETYILYFSPSQFSFAVLQKAINITRKEVHLDDNALKVCSSIYSVRYNNSSQYPVSLASLRAISSFDIKSFLPCAYYIINPIFFQVKYSAYAECEIIHCVNCEILRPLVAM